MMNLPFVQDVLATTGCCFDERFFCHCEDTDLVLRANLLGYRPACVDELVALHEGQANSLGQHSTSNAYQCLRNTICMPCKSMPT
jgi:GT2 family glycosyltransferase